MFAITGFCFCLPLQVTTLTARRDEKNMFHLSTTAVQSLAPEYFSTYSTGLFKAVRV